MAKQTICFRSDAGNDFPTEFEALKDDLRFYIFNVIKNEATAKQLAEAMVADLKPLYDMVAQTQALELGQPLPDTLISPGIGALIERMTATLPHPVIPEHVAWDGKRFVGTLSGEDKGDEFFNRWYCRKGDFPPPGDRRSALHDETEHSSVMRDIGH